MEDPNFSCATPINIPLERSLYVGNILSGILYGLDIFAFFASVYCISHRPPNYRKAQIFYIVCGGILLALTTIEVTVDALWGQYMWIDHRNYPGGPLGYIFASQSAWYAISGFVAGAAANILGDGLLVYRCYIIWGSRWYVVALPVLIYLGSSVLAIISVVQIALPRLSLMHGNLQITVPWILLSVSLNIIVTSMICFRLLRMRRRMREVLSPAMSRTYTNIAAMLVESAAPLSILGIGLAITSAQNGPLTFAFGYVWNMFTALSPQMIILRVAMGSGWLKETVEEVSTAAFAEHAAVHAQGHGILMTIHKIEGSSCGPGIPASSSDMSVKKHMGAANVVSLV